MARGTNGSSSYLDAGALAVMSGAVNLSMAGWVYRSATGTTSGFGRYADPHQFDLIHYSDNIVYMAASNGGVSYGHVTSLITGWNHYATTYDGAGSTNADKLKIYINGSVATLTFVGTIPSSLSAGTNPAFRVGMDNVGGNRFWSGRYAEVAVWGATLTAADIAMLAKAYSPALVRPEVLSHYWPMIGRYSPEPDVVGGAGATLVSSPSTEDHARVIYHGRRRLGRHTDAAGGGAFTKIAGERFGLAGGRGLAA